MTQAELERRIDEINAMEPEEATPEDLAAIEAAERETEPPVPLEDVIAELEGCSGRVTLRMPKSLHLKLKERATAEGVSLNTYMLYRLMSQA